MKIATTTQTLNKMCEDSTTCSCPIISGDKACAMVNLINEFVSETNPITIRMQDSDYREFLLYLALASLRDTEGGK